jgi:hypothetical protein
MMTYCHRHHKGGGISATSELLLSFILHQVDLALVDNDIAAYGGVKNRRNFPVAGLTPRIPKWALCIQRLLDSSAGVYLPVFFGRRGCWPVSPTWTDAWVALTSNFLCVWKRLPWKSAPAEVDLNIATN